MYTSKVTVSESSNNYELLKGDLVQSKTHDSVYLVSENSTKNNRYFSAVMIAPEKSSIKVGNVFSNLEKINYKLFNGTIEITTK